MTNERSVERPLRLDDLMAPGTGAFTGAVAATSLFPDSHFETILVRGPNRRSDFHTEPYDEFFLQLRGTIRVDTREPGGGVRRNLVREGEVFLVPGGVPHSPRRPAGTYGLVVEIRRRPADSETVEWRCERCDALVHRVELSSTEMIATINSVLESFYADEQRRTCRGCGTVLPVPGEFTLDAHER